MSFGMWLSFTVMASAIAVLFWVILGTSLRMNYKNENIEALDRMMWTAAGRYATPEFKDHLKFVAGAESCFVKVISEKDHRILLSLDSQGESAKSQADAILPENLFELLDQNDGCYSCSVADTSGNSEWLLQAVVIACEGGYRKVLVITKLLANIDYMLEMFNNRIIRSLFIILVIASVLSLMITHIFAAPINRLTEKARRLASGDYHVAFPKEGCYEVKELSETLEKAAQEFNATEELRREFIANISHDMKTPLTVIKMYAEMIQTVSGDNPEKREKHLERIISEVEKLSGFINDTMDLARLQSRTWEVKKEVFDMAHLIQSSMLAFEVHEELDDFEITLDLEEHLLVEADRKLTGRVIQNFISNALKFSLETKKIDLTAKLENDKVKVSVRDYGAGIGEESMPHIWERYYKVDPYGSNKTGTGIGLHIAKEILEMHEAEFGVESAIGRGSCFWFCLEAVKE